MTQRVVFLDRASLKAKVRKPLAADEYRAGPVVSRNDAQAVAIRMRLVVPARPNGIPAMTTMV
jgi:hypothetical protein